MSLSREEIQSSFASLDALLTRVEEVLKPVVSRSLAEVTKGLSPLENAKLQVTLAYTMNTLFYLYMKLQNANMMGHAIGEDMERLKGYMKKIQAAEKHFSGVSEEQLPGIKLNKAAAKRFIQHALAEPVATSQRKDEPKGEAEEVEASDDSASEQDEEEEA